MTRGRQAKGPGGVPLLGWKDIAFRTAGAVSHDRIGLIAAGVAFYGLLAIFPAIAFCMALAGLIVQPEGIVQQMEAAGRLLPDAAADIILSQARDVAGSQEGGLGLAAALGLLIALYSASRGTDSLIEGLNVAYGEGETRSFFNRLLLVLGLTLCLVIGTLLALALTAVLPAVLGVFGNGGWVETLVGVLRWPILVFGMMMGLSLLYRVGPNRRSAKWRWLTPGAALASVLWLAASLGFSFYVTSFGSYNETFGTLAGVVVLLMWFWISAFIVLLGAEVNGEMEAQTRRDSTIGKNRPMGERGAEKADNLGEATG